MSSTRYPFAELRKQPQHPDYNTIHQLLRVRIRQSYSSLVVSFTDSLPPFFSLPPNLLSCPVLRFGFLSTAPIGDIRIPHVISARSKRKYRNLYPAPSLRAPQHRTSSSSAPAFEWFPYALLCSSPPPRRPDVLSKPRSRNVLQPREI